MNACMSTHQLWSLTSPASPLFTQLFIQVQIRTNINALRHWPLCGEFTGDQSVSGSNEHWHMERAQHATYNPIYERNIETLPVVVLKKFKGPAHKVEGDLQLRRPHLCPHNLMWIYGLNIKE